MTALRTKLEGFQTQISKYFSERGDAVAKAAKNPHVVSVWDGCSRPDARVPCCAGEGVPGRQGSPLRGRGGARMPGFPTAQEGAARTPGFPSRGSGTPGMVGETLGPSFPWFCPPQGDYRQLVHELDEAQYAEIRLMVMEIRNLYAILYDIVVKNFEKIKKPRGETKGMIY
uniref:Proteasome activator PA28 C-terminal domain-containing protein n=1 Tax=Terrapene triunguis TaxID=2587831 RepID=A0A674IWH2_9SAUR